MARILSRNLRKTICFMIICKLEGKGSILSFGKSPLQAITCFLNTTLTAMEFYLMFTYVFPFSQPYIYFRVTYVGLWSSPQSCHFILTSSFCLSFTYVNVEHKNCHCNLILSVICHQSKELKVKFNLLVCCHTTGLNSDG